MSEANKIEAVERAKQGWVPDIDDKAELCEAITEACDYRGDITVTTKAGSTVEGYLFTCETGQGLEDSYIKIMPKENLDKLKIYYCDIARLEFSGRDMAHGKSWETWIRKWAEKKLKGEAANIYSEPLDGEEEAAS